jgi:malonyl-CoA O-methyltransferase
MILKNKVQQRFNKSAITYNSAADLQKRIARTLATTMRELKPKNILEIGCGTGLLSRELLTLFPTAEILLTDIAPNMLNACQKDLNTIANIKTLCIDGEKINLNTQFDLISSSMTMHWFNDFKSSLANLIAHLAPNGVLQFALVGKNSLTEWQQICSAEKWQVGTPNFPSQQSLATMQPGLELNTRIEQITYPNSYLFLKSLQQLGATATPAKYKPLRRAQLDYLFAKFNQPLTISYEIIYARYQRC